MRRALQYSAVTGRLLALHCEEPTLTRGGQMHEGAVSAELGFGGWPSVGESLMVARDLSLAAYERRPLHLMHLSARESVERCGARSRAASRASGEVTPHHLCLTDEAVRSLDPNLKMNPPLRAERDRAALIDALRDGTIAAIATDHAPHARQEKDVPFEAAPFGVTGLETAFAVALHAARRSPACCRSRRCSSGCRPGPARDLRPRAAAHRGRRAREPRPARPRARRGRSRGGLPLALGQLVAARRAAAAARRATVAAGRLAYEA